MAIDAVAIGAPVVRARGVSLGAMNSVFYLALSRFPSASPWPSSSSARWRRVCLATARLPVGGLAAIGLSLLLPITHSGAALDPIGVLHALAAGVGWALYIVFGQKAGQAQGPSASTWGHGRSDPDGARRRRRRWREALRPVHPWFGVGVGVAVFSSALPCTLEMIALGGSRRRIFGTLMSFDPAIAAIAGVVLLHEGLTITQWTAIGAIILASVGAVAGKPPHVVTERADFAP